MLPSPVFSCFRVIKNLRPRVSDRLSSVRSIRSCEALEHTLKFYQINLPVWTTSLPTPALRCTAVASTWTPCTAFDICKIRWKSTIEDASTNSTTARTSCTGYCDTPTPTWGKQCTASSHTKKSAYESTSRTGMGNDITTQNRRQKKRCFLASKKIKSCFLFLASFPGILTNFCRQISKKWDFAQRFSKICIHWSLKCIKRIIKVNFIHNKYLKYWLL